jgi:hypothetical protein
MRRFYYVLIPEWDLGIVGNHPSLREPALAVGASHQFSERIEESLYSAPAQSIPFLAFGRGLGAFKRHFGMNRIKNARTSSPSSGFRAEVNRTVNACMHFN